MGVERLEQVLALRAERAGRRLRGRVGGGRMGLLRGRSGAVVVAVGSVSSSTVKTQCGHFLAAIRGRCGPMANTSERMLRLLSLLQSHRDWSGADLAERLEVSPRTVRRDVDRLRMLGYPVDATPGVDGGYRLAAGAALPPLVLDDDEAVALVSRSGPRRAWRSAVPPRHRCRPWPRSCRCCRPDCVSGPRTWRR